MSDKPRTAEGNSHWKLIREDKSLPKSFMENGCPDGYVTGHIHALQVGCDLHVSPDLFDKIELIQEGFVVEYDFPTRHAPGEVVGTREEAEKLRERRMNEMYENVRISPALKKPTEPEVSE